MNSNLCIEPGFGANCLGNHGSATVLFSLTWLSLVAMTSVSFPCAIGSNILGTILLGLFTIQTAPVVGYDILLPVTEHIEQKTRLSVWCTSPRVGRFQYVTQVVIATLLACVTCRRRCWIEFFLNFSDKNICHYSERVWTGHLLHKRPGYYHSTSKTHVRDRILKLSPIFQNLLNSLDSMKVLLHLGKTPLSKVW